MLISLIRQDKARSKFSKDQDDGENDDEEEKEEES